MTTQEQAQAVVEKFRELGAPCSLAGVQEAPQLVRFDLRPENGSRMVDFTRLQRAKDIASALEAESVAISAPIPGTGLIGVEVARKDRQLVKFEDLPGAGYPLSLVIGTQVDGRPALLPLCDAPHVLISGQSGAGKSMLLHVILAQIIASHNPTEVGLALIDTKRVEFNRYESKPHVACLDTDVSGALSVLAASVRIMEDRYLYLQERGVRDISEENLRCDREGTRRMPYLVIVVDEWADLAMLSEKRAESLLVRLAQKGRASGIHLVVATQYPTANVVTGLLRVNLATKVALAVPDAVASRVILGKNGAESLLGKGDALLSFGGLPPVRFQSAYCSISEGDGESAF